MSTYAIGDLQGCYDDLQRLLEKIKFDPAADTIWLAGDLVNRGPKSLKTLRFIRSLGDAAVTVLGNHDLHLLAVAADHPKFSKGQKDLKRIVDASDAQELIDWVRHQHVMYSDDALNFHMSHAGVYPLWKIATAQKRARKLEAVLRSDDYQDFILNMYGNKPVLWKKSLKETSKLRFITNSFTRMRFVHLSDAHLDFRYKCNVGKQPKKLVPWFAHPLRKNKKANIIFGHWSRLSTIQHGNCFALDTGCLWGGKLTAYKLDKPREFTQKRCR